MGGCLVSDTFSKLVGREKAESSKRKEGNSSLNRNVNSSLNRGGKTAKRSSPSSCDRSVAQPILLQGKNKFTDYNSCRRDAWQAFRKKKKNHQFNATTRNLGAGGAGGGEGNGI